MNQKHYEKRKRKKKKKQIVEEKKEWDESSSAIFSVLLPTDQVSIFWKLYETGCLENNIKLSTLERGDALQVKHLVRVPNPSSVATYQPNQLATLVKSVCPKWKKVLRESEKGFEPGSPLLLVVTPNALRAVDYFRSLTSLKSKTLVVKLFGRHIKVADQLDALKKEVRLAVGTPGRILKLCQDGALHAHKVRYFLVDTARDAKKFSMLTTGQLKKDFFLLYHKFIHPNVLTEQTRVTFI